MCQDNLWKFLVATNRIGGARKSAMMPCLVAMSYLAGQCEIFASLRPLAAHCVISPHLMVRNVAVRRPGLVFVCAVPWVTSHTRKTMALLET